MIVVVGGSSFIGVYTALAFASAGFEVTATGRNPRFDSFYKSQGIPYISFDLSNPADLGKLPTEGVEGVALLAALLPGNSTSDLNETDNAADYIRVNAVGTANLLEYCRLAGAKLITTASYADVQCSWSADEEIREEWPRNFKFTGDHAAYVISKNAANDLVEYYNEQHGMSNVVFRLPPVYGVGPHGSLLVNGEKRKSGIEIFIENAKASKPITVYGDESVVRDIVYVKDVASAFVDAMRSDRAKGLYNIGSGCPSSLGEQARAIAEVFSPSDSAVPVLNDPAKQNGLTAYRFSIEKAVRDFGYDPRYADFKSLMMDWRKEEERGVFTDLFSS